MSRRETAGDYSDVLCLLTDRHRIIYCRDRIQWILQRRNNEMGTVWGSVRYCTTSKALKRECRSHGIDIGTKLDGLPENIREMA